MIALHNESPRGAYVGGIVTSDAKPHTRRLVDLPKGQTRKHIKHIRKAFNAYMKAKDEKPFGYDRAQRQLDYIADLCAPGGRLILALRGDCMPENWARSLREAAWAASLDLPVPGRRSRPTMREDGSTLRPGHETLGHAVDDLAEAVRDRLEWL